MSTTSADIARTIHAACPQVQFGEADYGTSLKDLGVDSLDVAVIFLSIAEDLGVLVPDAEIDALDTVDRIAAYVAGREAAR